MNVALAISFMSAFIFCFYLDSYWGGNQNSRSGTLATLLIALASMSTYAILKNQMHALYFNLVSLLFIENDHRISPVSIKAIDVLNNFVPPSNVD